jgi:hypothetical protein
MISFFLQVERPIKNNRHIFKKKTTNKNLHCEIERKSEHCNEP